MKVILAGMSKTGTKSMTAALRLLGMNVYDFLEHYSYHGDEWMRICVYGGTVDDFKEMYKDVDAVVDIPAWCFWEELHQAFPEAKIILTTRDEDEWIQSLKLQNNTLNSPVVQLMRYLSPSCVKHLRYLDTLMITGFGWRSRSWFRQDPVNELVFRMAYRRHNTYVTETAPKDKLLVYSVKEGWEPLCDFLGVQVPSQPFPHKNVRAGIFKDLMRSNPLVLKMKREMLFSGSLLSTLLLYCCYKFMQLPPGSFSGFLTSCSNFTCALISKVAFWKPR